MESLKLVFGTSAVKKYREENDRANEEVESFRKRKFYDFSETNVKVDEILSTDSMARNDLKDEINKRHDLDNKYVTYLKPQIQNPKSNAHHQNSSPQELYLSNFENFHIVTANSKIEMDSLNEFRNEPLQKYPVIPNQEMASSNFNKINNPNVKTIYDQNAIKNQRMANYGLIKSDNPNIRSLQNLEILDLSKGHLNYEENLNGSKFVKYQTNPIYNTLSNDNYANLYVSQVIPNKTPSSPNNYKLHQRYVQDLQNKIQGPHTYQVHVIHPETTGNLGRLISQDKKLLIPIQVQENRNVLQYYPEGYVFKQGEHCSIPGNFRNG